MKRDLIFAASSLLFALLLHAYTLLGGSTIFSIVLLIILSTVILTAEYRHGVIGYAVVVYSLTYGIGIVVSSKDFSLNSIFSHTELSHAKYQLITFISSLCTVITALIIIIWRKKHEPID